jgi:hypothetical protein
MIVRVSKRKDVLRHYALLWATFRLPRSSKLLVFIVIFPVVFITLAELGCKGAVKEVLASREIPFTHFLNISLFERSR